MAAHCSRCVCSLLCVCTLDVFFCRAQIQSMGHHTWLYVTTLHFTFKKSTIILSRRYSDNKITLCYVNRSYPNLTWKFSTHPIVEIIVLVHHQKRFLKNGTFKRVVTQKQRLKFPKRYGLNWSHNWQSKVRDKKPNYDFKKWKTISIT